jgi:hypothetical protein
MTSENHALPGVTANEITACQIYNTVSDIGHFVTEKNT